ncbi:MAG: ATP-dependent Clp protease ATP-binding subunit [Patescibacteria group bacterium]
MAEEDKKLPDLYIIECPQCHGLGRLVDGNRVGKCPNCGDNGLVAWLDGQYWRWGLKFSVMKIITDRAEQLGRSIINGILMALALVGFISGVWQFYQSWRAHTDILHWLNVRNGGMLVFWIALLLALYIFFRLERERTAHAVIDRKSIGAALIPAPAGLSYEDYKNNKAKASEVSQYLDWQAHRAVERAWLMANRLKHPVVEPIHLLAALFESPRVKVIMARLGVSPQKLSEKINRRFMELPRVESSEPALSSHLLELYYQAFAFAYEMRNPVVDAPDLFLAVTKVEAVAKDILFDMEVDETKLTNVVKWVDLQRRVSKQWQKFRARASRKPKGVMDRAMLAQATPVLDHFSRDLTQLARIGGLPLTVGRDKEVEEVFRVLESGRGSALIVGAAGVGKDMILNSIADRMAAEDVPEILRDKRFVSLSVASLVAGAGAIGELEERLHELLDEITKSGNVVLAVENLHTLVGVSSAGGQSMDLSEILAQALSTRGLVVVATSAPTDFRKFIEPRGSLMTHFQPLMVNEVDENTAILICETKVGPIEYHHRVFFTYEAIAKSVQLSKRYLRDLMLPTSAINLMEEVAVLVKKTKGANSIVTGEDVAQLVSQRANVAVTKLTEDETNKLLNMEDIIHQRLIDQEEAVTAVASALRRARAELRDLKRPIANLLFMGPTGVGKTELAKTVADVYFGSEENMIRLDMSEYQDKFSIYRLIGSPDGGSGYLTEAVRRNPFSLVLLDEIEKAHPDVLNVFLQVMDDGRLTDSSGRTIDFTNIILVATSNAATQLIQARVSQGVAVEHIKEEMMTGGLAQYFRPEFLNRFDNIVVFKPLSQHDIIAITRLLLKKVEKRLEQKGITLKVTDGAVIELATMGYDPIYGARPLRRVIQERVDDALSKQLLQGTLGRRDIAVLEAGGKITIQQAKEL